MTGADYIAQVRLTLKDGTVVAMPGERCERVPAVSLARLAERGRIRLAPRPAAEIATDDEGEA